MPSLYLYLRTMKNEIEIPIQKEEDFVAANLRRDKYSQTRDLQAQEFNSAIASRLLLQDKSQVKCEKCGKEFTVDANSKELMKCQECR
jgi:DNA-directed RNA polymerase subunit RPC12/RpoP